MTSQRGPSRLIRRAYRHLVLLARVTPEWSFCAAQPAHRLVWLLGV
jgi:hypothetical protein